MMHIEYGLSDCSLGRVIVAATENGICALGFGRPDPELTAFLHKEFPEANVTRNEKNMLKFLNVILGWVDGNLKSEELRLDLNGTNFQRKVWHVLRSIPYGSTRSYSQIALSIGQPKAVRAVAKACAANPVAILVPCHRVVRQDGSLGGYRWGPGLKRKLIEMESAFVSSLKS